MIDICCQSPKPLIPKKRVKHPTIKLFAASLDIVTEFNRSLLLWGATIVHWKFSGNQRPSLHEPGYRCQGVRRLTNCVLKFTWHRAAFLRDQTSYTPVNLPRTANVTNPHGSTLTGPPKGIYSETFTFSITLFLRWSSTTTLSQLKLTLMTVVLKLSVRLVIRILDSVLFILN